MENLTNAQLQEKAKSYAMMANEGGEGYNPFSVELDRRLQEERSAKPKTLEEQEASILSELSRKDNSIARESGTFDAEEVSNLRKELESVREKKEQSFFSEWTREETAARRHAWNSAMAEKMRTGEKVNILEMADKFGFYMEDLKKAVSHYNLPKWTA